MKCEICGKILPKNRKKYCCKICQNKGQSLSHTFVFDIDLKNKIKKMYLEDRMIQSQICKILNMSKIELKRYINHFNLQKENCYDGIGKSIALKNSEKVQQNKLETKQRNLEKKRQLELLKYGKIGLSAKEKLNISLAKSISKQKQIEKFKKQAQEKRDEIDKRLLNVFEKGMSRIELAKKANVPYTSITKSRLDNLGIVCKDYRSYPEKEVSKFLDSINVEYIKNDRQLIKPLELDFVIPEYKIAIEFNGNFRHCIDEIKNKRYHLNKSILVEEKGYVLIHIYEFEWFDEKKREKIKNLIKQYCGEVKKIYARSCKIKEIDNKIYRDFCEKNHLQGFRSAKIKYGLFYKDELVQLMSFDKPKYNKNYEWEIIRGCPGSLFRTIGGTGKLFSYFIKEHNPNSIMSYCDYNKFNGISYEKIGMEFVRLTGPDKMDIIGNKVTRHFFFTKERRLQFEEKYKNNCGYTIFGSGSKIYKWSKK